MTKSPKTSDSEQISDRDARLKQALRDNLRRRKTQAKAKKAGPKVEKTENN